jgi:hypothetical protein
MVEFSPCKVDQFFCSWVPNRVLWSSSCSSIDSWSLRDGIPLTIIWYITVYFSAILSTCLIMLLGRLNRIFQWTYVYTSKFKFWKVNLASLWHWVLSLKLIHFLLHPHRFIFILNLSNDHRNLLQPLFSIAHVFNNNIIDYKKIVP